MTEQPEYYVIVEMIDHNRYVYSFFSYEKALEVYQKNMESEIVAFAVITKVI